MNLNLRERLKIRGLITLVLTVLEKLVNIFVKLSPKTNIDNPPETIKRKRKQPIKKVIDSINNVLPMPWSK